MSYRKNYCEYDLVVPGTLRAGLEMLSSEPGRWRPFAGGTDIMVLLDSGKLTHKQFISIAAFPELKSVSVSDTAVRIGSAVTYSFIQKYDLLRA